MRKNVRKMNKTKGVQIFGRRGFFSPFLAGVLGVKKGGQNRRFLRFSAGLRPKSMKTRYISGFGGVTPSFNNIETTVAPKFKVLPVQIDSYLRILAILS